MEFFDAVVGGAGEIDLIESSPHFPPVEGVHYLNDFEVAGTEDGLTEFLELFNPCTEIDRPTNPRGDRHTVLGWSARGSTDVCDHLTRPRRRRKNDTR